MHLSLSELKEQSGKMKIRSERESKRLKADEKSGKIHTVEGEI